MSLMSALSVGRLGLQTSQNALNTVAHNVSNADTTGYTRQQVQLGDNVYQTIKYNFSGVSSQQVGLGVMYTQTRQVRDDFLDKLYRKESGRSAFYEVSYDALYQIENIMGEPGENPFQASVDRLWEAIEELSKEPESAVCQGLLVQRANQFIDEANIVYKELRSYQDNLNQQVFDNIKTINKYGKAIYELNEKISRIEAGGVEHANDLRDQRNYYLDELAKMTNMTYSVDVFGNYNVKIDGESFVTRGQVYEIGAFMEENGFYTPYWTHLAEKTIDRYGRETLDISHAKVVDTNKAISTAQNTDIGKLESLLYARGDHRANYTELETEEKYDKISRSLIMNVQAEFDRLIHDITTGINEILANASDPTTGYLCNDDGTPLLLFLKSATDTEFTTDADGNLKTKEDPDQVETLYTVGNIRVNDDLIKQPTLLGFIKGEDSVDYETAQKLYQLFEEETHALNPNVKTLANFSDYYINLTNQIANSGSAYKKLSEDQQGTVGAASAAREQIIGVSTDEELTNMIKFQNAYNASSRYINAVDELLEHLINALA
ncbi:MAG: flagellar hook-associated protein FlgK [Clostridium sp.]|nr:flagellar hook-associated protein FlgK [Clostridium sp.]